MKKLYWCLPGLLAALCACGKKEAEAPAAAPPSAEAPAAPAAPLSQGNSAERYVSGLQSSVEKAKGARDKANAAIQRSTPAEQPSGE